MSQFSSQRYYVQRSRGTSVGWGRVITFCRRHRRRIRAAAYASVIITAMGLLYDSSLFDGVFQLQLLQATMEDPAATRQTTYESISTTPRPTLSYQLDFNFVPKDFSCNDIFYDTNYSFAFSSSYAEHLDSYQSATIFAGITQESVANEQTWIMHEIAKNPAIKTICETGFKAGHNSFHWLTAQEESIVYSFEEEERYNYTKEITMFMTSEFPDRFYAFFGDPKSTVQNFMIEYNETRCDMIFLDSTHDKETLTQNIKNFAAISSKHNIVILDSHPQNATSLHAVEVWEKAKRDGVIHESFRCHFAKRENDPSIRNHQQNGLLIGSYTLQF